ARVFHNDDDAYVAWLAKHPNGFVLNCHTRPSRHYLKVHKATCGTIGGTPANGVQWTSDYLKVCSDTRLDLRVWANAAAGGDPSPCGLCMRTILAAEGQLPSQFAEVQAYLHLKHLLEVAVDMQIVDLRAMFQLPTKEIRAGCNLTVAARLFDLISGSS